MKINHEPKLDFDDILLVPQRSTVKSRKDVDLKRTFKFYHSRKEWSGLPIMAANMDTTATFAMGASLNNYDAITCLHKHYSPKQINDYFEYYNHEKNVWVSIGMGNWDIANLHAISDKLHHPPNICIDIANGYTEKFVEWCSDVRSTFPDSIIMAGNVCTPEMVQELILHGGVDIVKIGIGPGSACTTRLKTGCFTGESKVTTSTGLKSIKDVSVGDRVLTHDGTYHAVTNVHNNGFKDNLVQINGITCTDDHEFYVVNKADQGKITEDNIHNFAYWMEAKNISEEKHFIIEICD